MRKKYLPLSGLFVSSFVLAFFPLNVKSSYEILSPEELESLSKDDLIAQYNVLAKEYTSLLNISPSDSAKDCFDFNTFKPGEPIDTVYSLLGAPTSVEDLLSTKAYNFSPKSFSFYNMSDFIFTVFTDSDDKIQNYTFCGACSLDAGDDIWNRLISDLNDKYGQFYNQTNVFGVYQYVWNLAPSDSYSTVFVDKDSYKSTAISFLLSNE